MPVYEERRVNDHPAFAMAQAQMRGLNRTFGDFRDRRIYHLTLGHAVLRFGQDPTRRAMAYNLRISRVDSLNYIAIEAPNVVLLPSVATWLVANDLFGELNILDPHAGSMTFSNCRLSRVGTGILGRTGAGQAVQTIDGISIFCSNGDVVVDAAALPGPSPGLLPSGSSLGEASLRLLHGDQPNLHPPQVIGAIQADGSWVSVPPPSSAPQDIGAIQAFRAAESGRWSPINPPLSAPPVQSQEYADYSDRVADAEGGQLYSPEELNRRAWALVDQAQQNLKRQEAVQARKARVWNKTTKRIVIR